MQLQRRQRRGFWDRKKVSFRWGIPIGIYGEKRKQKKELAYWKRVLEQGCLLPLKLVVEVYGRVERDHHSYILEEKPRFHHGGTRQEMLFRVKLDFDQTCSWMF